MELAGFSGYEDPFFVVIYMLSRFIVLWIARNTGPLNIFLGIRDCFVCFRGILVKN
jgi:hypothetical protein